MKEIDTSRPVMVTGATGYVAGWVVKRLLEAGHTVHATVRDPANKTRLAYLDDIAARTTGTLRYFKADLLTPGSYAEGMQGCGVVMHTASPFTLTVDDPQKDLIEPAQLGTRNVLEEATRSDDVQRVVVTSSVAAIHGDNADIADTKTGRLTESDWNTSSSLEHQPYSYSKTLAEREAWSIAGGQDRWDLVTINPSLVLGPGINPHATSESYALLKRFGDGTLKFGVPAYGIGVVDVRDVATAHLKAAFDPAARGRYLTSAHDTSFAEIGRILRERYGNRYPFPRRIMPKWLLWLVGPMVDKAMTRKMISRNIGTPFKADNSRSVKELGLSYRPLAESVVELFQQMIDAGVIA